MSPGTEAAEVQKVSSDWKPFYVTSAQKKIFKGEVKVTRKKMLMNLNANSFKTFIYSILLDQIPKAQSL